MSVVLSKPSRGTFAQNELEGGTLAERAAAFASCFAYFGRFEVKGNTVVHRIEHCTLPNWLGTEQVRFFKFADNRLILRTPPMPRDGRQSVSTLVWERVGGCALDHP